MEVAAYIFTLAACIVAVVAAVFLAVNRDAGLWASCASVILFVLAGSCWLQGRLWKQDASAVQHEDATAPEHTKEVINQMRLDQRAWLSVVEPQLDDLAEREPMRVRFLVRNTGKTPGTIIESTLDPHIVVNDEEIDELMGEKSRLIQRPLGTQTSIAPGSERHIVRTHESFLDKLHVELIENGGLVVLFAGQLIYKDPVGHIGHTTVCYTYEPKTKRLIGYHKYNEMD